MTKGRWPRRNLKISELRELRGREKERQTEGVAYDFNYSWQHASLIASSQRCFHLRHRTFIRLFRDFFATFSHHELQMATEVLVRRPDSIPLCVISGDFLRGNRRTETGRNRRREGAKGNQIRAPSA